MDKETLFKAIQRRQVVLWTGAGFSKYAGMPLGAEVVRRLFDGLSKAQQEEMRLFAPVDADGYPIMGLPAFSSTYVEMHNGQHHALRRELKKFFSIRPKSLKTHEELAQIPFIEHIITTNYDSLFEQAYGTDQLHVVTSGRQLPYQELGQATLYKVHGTLEDLDSLLITEDHYRAFYDKSDKLLWNYIESLMTTHTVLFVGYGLEDTNVLALFERILDAVGENMRGAYLVAPSLNPIHVERLKRRNVTYLQSTGEALVSELLQYLKDNALPELQIGGIELEPTAKFLRKLGLDPTIRVSNGSYVVSKLTSTRPGAMQQFKFAVDILGSQAIENLKSGNGGFSLKLEGSQLLNFDWRVDGVRLGFDPKSMWLVRQPSLIKTVDIEFENGVEIDDAKLLIYGGTETLHIVAYTPHIKVDIKVKRKQVSTKGLKFNFTITRRHTYIESVESGLHLAHVMKAFGSGEPLKVFENGQLIWQNPRESVNELLDEGKAIEKRMLALRNIERAFNIRFKRFNFSVKEGNTFMHLSNILELKQIPKSWAGTAEVDIDTAHHPDPVSMFKQIVREDKVLVNSLQQHEKFKFMGWELQLDYLELQIVHAPAVKKISTGYLLSSKTKKVETHFYNAENPQVLTKGTPKPPHTPEDPMLPKELQGAVKLGKDS